MLLIAGAEGFSAVNVDASNPYSLIRDLLSSSALPPYTMNIDQLNGYLCAVAAEPQVTTQSAWMPLIFGGELPQFIEGFSVDSISNALLWLYTSRRTELLAGRCELEFCCEYSPDKNARLRSEQWARGFLQGYIFWQDIWSQFLDESQTSANLAVILPISIYDEIDDILATISAVADADYALYTGVTIDNLMLMFSQLDQKVIEYGRIAQIIRNSSSADVFEQGAVKPSI